MREVTASGRSAPPRMCEITEGIVANMNCTRPASRSFSASAPLYGTWVVFTPVRALNSTPERCAAVPTPVELKFSVLGCVLA
ncbi:hypothetical protein D3C85_1427760 [compost metagenome]